MDESVKTIGHRAGLDLGTGIIEHTVFHIGETMARYSPNVADLLNRYPDIVAGIHENAGAQFAVVSGTIEGSDWAMFTTYPVVGTNTLEIGSSYVHVSYACQTFESLRHRAFMADSAVPLIVYLTPIKYDASTARLVANPQPGALFLQ